MMTMMAKGWARRELGRSRDSRHAMTGHDMSLVVTPASVNDMLQCGSLSVFPNTGDKDKQARPERRQEWGVWGWWTVGKMGKMGKNEGNWKWQKGGKKRQKLRLFGCYRDVIRTESCGGAVILFCFVFSDFFRFLPFFTDFFPVFSRYFFCWQILFPIFPNFFQFPNFQISF